MSNRFRRGQQGTSRTPSISDGVKIRAQIDAESVRNVMLVNGGGSVALLALLPSVLGTPLVGALLGTLAVWLLGLTLAVTHSILRRKCSLIYEKHKMMPPRGESWLFVTPKEPWVCWWSWRCLYTSVTAFLAGGAVMVVVGFANLEELRKAPETVEHEVIVVPGSPVPNSNCERARQSL